MESAGGVVAYEYEERKAKVRCYLAAEILTPLIIPISDNLIYM